MMIGGEESFERTEKSATMAADRWINED